MGRLVFTEIRRDLARPAVRLLILVALAGLALTAVLSFVNTDDPGRSAYGDEFQLTDVWDEDLGADGDQILAVGISFLLLGALLAGATVFGAEWRYGTLITQLTWEPRRARVLVAKLAAAALLAAVIGFVLQSFWVAAFVPTAVVKGGTAGADAAWWLDLGEAMLRGSTLAAFAALLAGGIAMIGRNTAAALAVVLGWLAVGEPLLGVVRPEWQDWFVAPNLGAIILWDSLEFAEAATRTPGVAAVTLLLYVGVVLGVAGLLFVRRDLGTA